MSESLLCNRSETLLGISRYGLFPFGNLAHHYGGIPDSLVFTAICSIVAFVVSRTLWSFVMGFLYEDRTPSKFFNWEKLNLVFTTEWFFFHLSTMIDNYGLDGMRALLLQRYLGALMLLYASLTLVITLPINIYYGRNRHPDEFESGILDNVRTSQVLWIHVILGWSYLPISLVVMKHFWNTAVVPYAKSDDGTSSRCYCANKMAVTEHYEKELKKTEDKIQNTLSQTFNKPLSIAFVTAIRWTEMYVRTRFQVKSYVVHAFLIVFLVFLTSPQAFVEQFEIFWDYIEPKSAASSLNSRGFVLTYGVDFMKFTIQLVVSSVVTTAIKFIGYWREEVLNRKLLRFVTFYIMGTVVIGPTLEFFTIEALFAFSYGWFKGGFAIAPEIVQKWNCVFLAKGGLHYVDLILIGTFLGNMIEICQVKEMLLLFWDIVRSKSIVEMKVRGRKRIFELWPGDFYAKGLFYTMAVVALSMSTPMVTPFGTAFAIIRHIVLTIILWRTKEHRANITKVDSNFIKAVVGLVACGPLILQWYTWFFLNIRSGTRTIDLFSGIMAITSSLFVAVSVTFDWTFPIMILKPLPKQYSPPGPYYPQAIKEEYVQVMGD